MTLTGGHSKCLPQQVDEDVLVNTVQGRGKLLTSFLYESMFHGEGAGESKPRAKTRICEATWMLHFERGLVETWKRGLHSILEANNTEE